MKKFINNKTALLKGVSTLDVVKRNFNNNFAVIAYNAFEWCDLRRTQHSRCG